MFVEVVADGQSARTVADEVDAGEVREALRRQGRESGVRLRTARMDDLVVAARLDAAIWTDDTATMRDKLTPPPPRRGDPVRPTTSRARRERRRDLVRSRA